MSAIEAWPALPSPSFRLLSQHVAHALRRVILNGRFKPGDRLPEQELANELQVSRAPVRDALRLLAKEGLVTLVPHRGAIVTEISAELVIDAFSTRAVLEGMAARLATPYLTPETLDRLAELVRAMDEPQQAGNALSLVDLDIEFHRVLTVNCRRPVLLDALGAISNRTHVLISASRQARPSDRLAELHGWILQAARSQDPDQVEQAVRDHIAYGQHTLLTSLASDRTNGGGRSAEVFDGPSSRGKT